MSTTTENVVIIGSGPAGWTAAIYAARANLHPLVYEGAVTDANRVQGTLPLGQLNLTTEVENFPTWPHVDNEALQAFSKSALPEDRYYNLSHLYEGKSAHKGKRAAFGPELMEYARQQALNFGTRIITKDVLSVELDKHPFVIHAATPGEDDSQETVYTKALIIATGARANYLGLPSEDRFKNFGVSACAVCDGALPRFKGVPLVVVGGGDTAVEEATYLTQFASKVHLVHRRDKLRASQVMQQRAINHPKINMRWNREVVEVLGDDKHGVTAVRLKSTVDGSTEVQECAGLFVAIGHTPNTAFLKGQLQTNEKGYLVWTKPHRTNTSIDGVFAAGDVADDYYRQAVTAAASGCMAALDVERWLAAQGLH